VGVRIVAKIIQIALNKKNYDTFGIKLLVVIQLREYNPFLRYTNYKTATSNFRTPLKSIH